MSQIKAPHPGLWIAAVLIIVETVAQALLLSLTGWELSAVFFALLLSWGLLRKSRIAWGLAIFGSACQMLAGAFAGPPFVSAIGGLVLLLLLFHSSVRNVILLDPSGEPSHLPSVAGLSSPDGMSGLAFRTSMKAEDLAARIDRRLLVRSAIGLACLFFLVGVVGNWHGRVKHQTDATEAIWSVVVTSYKVALVAFVALAVLAGFGVSVRRRSRTDSHPQ